MIDITKTYKTRSGDTVRLGWIDSNGNVHGRYLDSTSGLWVYRVWGASGAVMADGSVDDLDLVAA